MIKKYDVDIDLANETKKEMAKTLATDDKRVLNRVGAFASLYDINYNEYTEPVLVLKTEEPGSKQIVAFKYDKIENVCFDMINHLVNDCIVMGAKPLTVQDAIICGKMDKEIVSRIVKAIFEACKRQGCVLTGGETSEQPNVIGKNTYILTSSIVGIVEKQNIIDGTAYPAPYEDMNIKVIPHMAEAFDCITGLSDHSMGAAVAVASVALGARMVEKHFTLSRADGGPDGAFSMEPAEFKQMVDEIRTVEKALGRVTYSLTQKQERSREEGRSLFVTQDMKAGEVFTPENLRSIRPAFGMAPVHYEELLGKKARCDISRGTPMDWKFVE